MTNLNTNSGSNLDQRCSQSNLNMLSISSMDLILSITLYIMKITRGKKGKMGSSGKVLDSKNTLRGLKVDNVTIIYHKNLSFER